MGEWAIGTTIGDYIGTTVRIRFPHSLLRTRQSWRCSGGFRAYWLCRVCRAYRVNKLVGFKVHLGLVGFIIWFVGFIGLIGFRVEGLWFRVE